MVHLSVGLTQRELPHRFDIHQSTVSRIITTWANFLYTVLGSVCIWMSEEAVKAHMPKEFQDYPDTQVVIDCTELRCQTPSSLLLQSEVFSSYKSHCTFKGLIGMAPHGAVTFVIPVCRIHQQQGASQAVWDCVSAETRHGYYGRQRFSRGRLCAMQSLQTCLPVKKGTDVG